MLRLVKSLAVLAVLVITIGSTRAASAFVTLNSAGRPSDECPSGGGHQNNNVEPGETVRMAIVVQNAPANEAATGVSVAVDTTNPFVTFLGSKSTSVPNIPINMNRFSSTTIDYRVSPDIPCGSTIVFDLRTACDQPECPVMGTYSEPIRSSCVRCAAASPDFTGSTKSVSPRPQVPTGDPLSYALRVTNAGQGGATVVVLQDDFPSCVTVPPAWNPSSSVVVAPGPAAVSYTAPRLTIELGSMSSGASHDIVIGGLRAGGPAASCCNQATLRSAELPGGQVTDDPAVPGAGNTTCVEITSAVDCPLSKATITFPPVAPPRVAPWVYTATANCSALDSRVGMALEQAVFTDDVDLSDDFASTLQELKLYQVGCPCGYRLAFTKTPATGKVHVLRF